MSTSGSLSKTQVHSKSGALALEDFETLWRAVKAYMRTLPDDSPLVRGPIFGSVVRADSAAFTQDLNSYFTHGDFGNKYWAAGSGTEFIYPEDQKEIMLFFRILIVTMGGSIRQGRKRISQKRAQRNRTVQQAEISQSQAPARADTPIASLPANVQNVHAKYITNPDECDDKLFEASLGDEKPRGFLVSPLSIKFNQFFRRFCECWDIDIKTVDMDTVEIRVSIEEINEYTLDPDNFSSSWRNVMKAAETAPDSRIKIAIQIHGHN